MNSWELRPLLRRSSPRTSFSTVRRRSLDCFSLPRLYLETKNISGIVYATGAWPVDEERGWVGRIHRQTDIALGYGLIPKPAEKLPEHHAA